jgi:hypothetical protein
LLACASSCGAVLRQLQLPERTTRQRTVDIVFRNCRHVLGFFALFSRAAERNRRAVVWQVHNMVLLSAIEKEHQNAMEDFEGFMLSCAEADWEKHQATHGFAGVGGYGGGGGGFTPMDTATLLEGPATPATRRGLFADTGTPAKASTPFARLGGERPEAYLSATKALNSARLQGAGATFNAVAAFADAAATTGASAGAGSAMQSSIGSCWTLLRAMMGDGGGAAAQPATLVAGAKKHLEAGHAAYMLDVVRKHAQVARLGGDTAALAQVRSAASKMLGLHCFTQRKWKGCVRTTALLSLLLPATRESSYWLRLLCSPRFTEPTKLAGPRSF